jgi:proline iminopeptidase
LRGIFLSRPQDIKWFYQEGASRLFPDYWQDYMAPIPPDERHDVLGAFHKRLTGSDQIAQMHAAKAWSTWEGRTATLRPNPQVVDRFTSPIAPCPLRASNATTSPTARSLKKTS